MLADDRDQKRQQGERRHRLQHRDDRQQRGAAGGQRQAAMPIGTPSATASPSDPNTRSRCSPSSLPKSVANTRSIRLGPAPSRAPEPAKASRGRPAPSDEALGDLREAAAVELDLRVERDHRRRVDAAFEAAQRRGSSAARISKTAS
jgi:hypothetical protein